ncbi:MAG TPA: cupredoxin domain-containing protein [Candidatus Limnocylindrales bacterium]|jgi:plastocyanin
MEPTAAPAKDIIQTLLDVAAAFIIPDWRALILLLPIALALLFAVWFLFTVRKFATLGPRRRAPARVQPVTPASIHMPGGSSAPILVAFGAAFLFVGLVVGGIALWIGVVAIVVTLVAWFREAMRDYDQIESTQLVPVVVHEGPPPGVHMPGPSIRPLLGALGSAALLGGLVVGGWVLILAVVFLVYTLIGWLIDFTAEYRKVEEADKTGHLENIPDRKLPLRTLQVFAVLFALVGLYQLGIFPPPAPAAGGVPGASGAPAASGGATTGCGPAAPGALALVAKDAKFNTKALDAPAGKPFAIFLCNEDGAVVPHDVEIRSSDGATLQKQPPTPGGTSSTYQYTPLETGAYVFICSIHPIAQMTGTLTVN